MGGHCLGQPHLRRPWLGGPWPGEGRLVLALAASLLLGGLDGVMAPALRAAPQEISLECRLGEGPWQPCRMTIESVGERWQIEQNGRRVDFRHDGRGVVQMLRPGEAWQSVKANWVEDQALCWDGLCAKGDFPLD